MLDRSVSYLVTMLRTVAAATEKELKAAYDAGFDEGYQRAYSDQNGEEIEEVEE